MQHNHQVYIDFRLMEEEEGHKDYPDR